jgi:tetratricopeptide (TPR) repeat protein
MLKKALILSLWMALLLFAASAQASETQGNEKLHSRAKNLYDVGDYRAALDLYERILAQNPDDGLALDLSAWCLRYLGKWKSSEEMFEKALTSLRGADAVWVLIGLGEIYLDGKLHEKALTRFQEALRAASDNPEASERASRGIDLAQKALQEAAAKNAPPQTAKLTDSEERQKDVLLGEQNASSAPKTAAEAPAQKARGSKPPVAEPRKNKPQKAKPREAKAPQPPKAAASSKEAPAKPAQTPLRYGTVYGITLGMKIDEAITRLKKDGHPIAGDAFVKEGKTYYAVEGFPAVLPSSLTMNAVSRHFYVTEYNEAVLSVIVQLNYDKTRPFEKLKNTLREELPSLTGISDTRGAKAKDNIFSYEIGLALSNTYGIWMYVTDKANGTSSLEIEHVNLTNLSHYWMAGKK